MVLLKRALNQAIIARHISQPYRQLSGVPWYCGEVLSCPKVVTTSTMPLTTAQAISGIQNLASFSCSSSCEKTNQPIRKSTR